VAVNPLYVANSKRVSSAMSARSTASLRTKRSLTFDTRANRYDIIHEVADKRKNRHYRKLIENMRKQYPGHDVQFVTAGAFTTGGLGKPFQNLIKTVNVIAQQEKGGCDPEEIIDGLRGCVAVAIQQGNAMVVNDSWNRISGRNYRRILPPDKSTESVSLHVVTVPASGSAPSTEFSLPSSFSATDTFHNGRMRSCVNSLISIDSLAA